jgi:hypothetical protein
MVDGDASSSAQVQENVAELQFGPEFSDIHVLSNAQVAVVLQVSATSAVHRDEELHDVYRKTQKYVNRFNSMTNPEKDHQEIVDELDNLQEYVALCSVVTAERGCHTSWRAPWHRRPALVLVGSRVLPSLLVRLRGAIGAFLRDFSLSTDFNATFIFFCHCFLAASLS